jgi:hypothetical protein
MQPVQQTPSMPSPFADLNFCKKKDRLIADAHCIRNKTDIRHELTYEKHDRHF